MTALRRALVAHLYETVGFSEEDALALRKRSHKDYTDEMIALAPTFELLSRTTLPKGSVKAIAPVASISYGTVRDWRLKLHADPDWRPYEDRNRHRRTLSEEEEREPCKQIREQYIEPGFYCPPKVAQVLTRRIHGASVPEKLAWDRDENSEDGEGMDEDEIGTETLRKKRKKPHKGGFTQRWRAAFFERNDVSLRRPHLKRHSPMNDELAARFLEDADICFEAYERENILNMGETQRCLINSHQITITPRGAEGVSANFSCDPKMSLTAIAFISAAVDKLPLSIICRETTERCEQRFRDHFAAEIVRRKLILCYQISRWPNNMVVKMVLRWVTERTRSGRNSLLWDTDIAHRDQAVKQYAAQKGLKLVFISPGMTDKYQPLDWRLFGSLKSRARARFDNLWIQHPGKTLTLMDAMAILLDVWETTSQEEILDAWSKLDPETSTVDE
jgi:hypothetical protein